MAGAEWFHAMEDLAGYARLGWNKAVVPFTESGADYTDRRYKDSVREAVDRLHPRRMKLRVARVIDETPTTKTFRFERLDGPLPPFRPGQYLNVFVNAGGVSTSRPYSISSAPGLPHLDLTVRAMPGSFVAAHLINMLKTGAVVETSGPTGSFRHEPLIDGKDLIFLAGGSGITPFMSILRDQAQRDWPLRIHLLYGSRDPNDAIFADELEKMARGNENFKFTLVISEPRKSWRGAKGFLDTKLLREKVGDISGKTFYVCGPGAMYELCTAALAELGVPEYRVRHELYGPPADVTREPGWPKKIKRDAIFKVEVEGRGTIEARAGEPLLNSLERGGIVAPAQCRSGECSACRTRVIEGRVFMPAHAGVREADSALNYVHACVAYPIEDLKIRL